MAGLIDELRTCYRMSNMRRFMQLYTLGAWMLTSEQRKAIDAMLRSRGIVSKTRGVQHPLIEEALKTFPGSKIVKEWHKEYTPGGYFFMPFLLCFFICIFPCSSYSFELCTILGIDKLAILYYTRVTRMRNETTDTRCQPFHTHLQKRKVVPVAWTFCTTRQQFQRQSK